MAELILEMKHITKQFSGVKALDDVNLQVKKGEIHALCGENGAGKSTLMNVLSGVYPFGTYAGEILYKGELCKFSGIKDSEHQKIVIIHQELALSPYLSIAENVFIGNEVTDIPGVINWTKTQKRAQDMLEKVGLGNENVNLPVNTLGVGKQQLIEIAKALAKDVDLLILDEPTAALNDEESSHLLQIMLQLKAQGITCIMISHKLNELSFVADSITVIRDGKTIETLEKGKDLFTEDRIIKSMVGRELTNRYPVRECEIKETVLEVENWQVYSPEDADRQIIKNASFHVRAGEVVGFAGLMGAGRTELAMSVFGKAYGQKISGVIKLRGKAVELKSVQEAIRSKMAYVSEDRKTYGLVLIDDLKRNMSMAALKSYFSNKGVVVKHKEITAAENYKEKMNIKASSIEQIVGSLSGGNQQKVVLAKWILTDPDVLILDEPTRGIDVGAKYEIYGIINQLAQQGKAIILISSEMPEIIGTCDRAYVINEGCIAGELAKGDLTPENIMKCIVSHDGKENQS
ncbi:MAG: ATP-binding cassette domain-containing protein [Clostridiales bacterium]|nr:ATP-binding cassette domain-containing protein [Clostridiales bacterium]